MDPIQTLDDEAIIRSFPRYEGKGEPGFITDFLGTKTRLTSLNIDVANRSGRVEDYPFPGNFHATPLEWAGALRSILDAKDQYVMVEIGAGWGPWMMSMAHAAKQRGIKKFHFVGVEASKEHWEFMRTHFRDNGFNPDDHNLVHGVVGPEDGFAEFPIIPDPSVDYGRAAIYDPQPRTFKKRLKSFIKRLIGRAEPGPRLSYERLRCYSIDTLLKPFREVNLVHIDIQGGEREVVPAARAVLQKRVRWVVIGTHGREIEASLRDEMRKMGWYLETEEECMFTPDAAGQPVLARDGCQVWRNPRLVASVGRAAA